MDCSGFRDDQIDVLYAEASEETRLRVEAHLRTCAACREEMDALRAVRGQLQQWKAPAVRPLLWRRSAWRPLPLLAAAATLLLASGAALALRGSEIRYQDGRWSARLGKGADVASLLRSLEEQEARHHWEMSELRAQIGASPAQVNPAALGETTLKQMAEMIRASEVVQEGKVEKTLARFADQVESRRRYDLARVGASFAYLDGKNGQQLSRTTELMGYVLEANQKGGAR